MSSLIKAQVYTALVQDIAVIYTRGCAALVEAYWQIGRRIVEQEQQGDGKAEYGAQLLGHLSEDLQQKLGSGFSVRSLSNMRRFYLNNRIWQHAAKLNWSQHVEALPGRCLLSVRQYEPPDDLRARHIPESTTPG